MCFGKQNFLRTSEYSTRMYKRNSYRRLPVLNCHFSDVQHTKVHGTMWGWELGVGSNNAQIQQC